KRARAARQDVDSMHVQSEVLGNIHEKSEFIGYDQLSCETQIIALLHNGELVAHASEGDEIQFMLERTPFYAESGGQIADKGTISSDTFIVDVKDVKKAPNGQHLHTALVRSGEITNDSSVTAVVDSESRKRII